MSDSLWPHGLQLARLFCLWASLGKNTGVDCHFLLQGSSQPGLCPGDFPGKSTEMGFHFLLQGILPDPGIKPRSPTSACRFFTTVPPESEVAQSCLTLCDPMDCSLPISSVHGIFQARILEWVAISFSRGSSQPRDRTWVSCIAGRRFTVWATREAL